MSTAKAVKQYDRNAIAWIDIEDDVGQVHHYVKRAVIANADAVHVQWQGGQTVALTYTLEGPTLTQAAPGLPERIVVTFLIPYLRQRHRRVEFYDYAREAAD